MSLFINLQRETWFLARDRKLIACLFALLCLAALSVASGLKQLSAQHALISQLNQQDAQLREQVRASKTSWGELAYYSFHLTYDPPAPLAFAAHGLRDELPWKHRIRMLALEGQIYEQDLANPELALWGRFDFAFLAAYLAPLLLILLLFDGQARERQAGRFNLLVTTAPASARIWPSRSGLICLGVVLALLVPLAIGAFIAAVPTITLAKAMAAVALYLITWAAVCHWVASIPRPQGVLLSGLLGLWLVWVVIIPSAGRLLIDRAIALPSGADISLTQREAVNDAWDLPKAATMDAFGRSHPQWQNQLQVEQPFEWKWYFAFQQVGDETTAPLTQAYLTGRKARDRWAARLAWFAPPVLMERTLSSLAATDLTAALAYEQQVRAFHRQLREFYYPKLFTAQPYTPEAITERPEFVPLFQH